MIYAILTTSLIEDYYDVRKKQYQYGIKINIENLNKIPNIKIIIVENNGNIHSFLDDFNHEVIYTDNNFIETSNKGHKELMDILEVINFKNIKDDDFVIKVTGRYIIDWQSNFIDSVKELSDNTDCIIKYGSHDDRIKVSRVDDCITGLIGMRAKFIKQINRDLDDQCIEWKWARVANTIPDDRIIILNELGIHVIGLHLPEPGFNSKK